MDNLKKISEIKPYPKNAKKHPEKQIIQVANSIKEFGFNQPIVIDKEGVIIVGHGRYEASKHLGLTEVPVIVADLTDEQARAYRLADNKLNESGWEMDLVIEELKELSLPLFELTGFDRDLLLEAEPEDDEIPEVPEVPKTKLGDIYELGKHRVICGDSTKMEDVERLMNGVMADSWITDPPYNVAYNADKKGKKTIENDDMDDATFLQFITDASVTAISFLKAGGVFYIWHADSEGFNFRTACKNAGLTIRQCLIWVKNSMVMGRQDYQWKHEPCLYGWKDGSGHLWNSDRTQTTVLNFDKPHRNGEHPTMKPVELIAYQVTNNTKEGDLVLDTFLGSGSTLIASEKTRRVCYGVELDPKYVDVIVQRYVNYSGNENIKLNGEPLVWEKKETTTID